MKGGADIENALEALAKELGIRVRVTREPRDSSWHIDASLTTPRAGSSIDEDILLSNDKEAAAKLIYFEMERLQATLIETVAKRLGELDRRGRKYTLDMKDKGTLHEMLRDATDHLYSKYYAPGDTASYEAVEEKRRRYTLLARSLL